MEKKFLNQSKPDPVREYEREERIRKWSEKQRREEEKEPKTKEISQETAEAIVELLLTISFRIVKFFVIKFITLISKTVSFVVKPLKTKEKFLVLRLISFVLRSVLVLFILFYLSLFLMLV